MKKLLGYFLLFNVFSLLLLCLALVVPMGTNDIIMLNKIYKGNIYIAVYLLGILFTMFLAGLMWLFLFIIFLIND